MEHTTNNYCITVIENYSQRYERCILVLLLWYLRHHDDAAAEEDEGEQEQEKKNNDEANDVLIYSRG